MKIGIGNDHVAVEYKKEIKKYFYKKGNVCWDLVISLESDEEAGTTSRKSTS